MSTSTERMRHHRLRRQNGLRCITLELRDSEVPALIRKGFLAPKDYRSDQAIRNAIYSLLDRHLGAGS